MKRQLTLYSKPGCHLCEDLRALLDELDAELDIAEIDITQDAALFSRYRYDIPVLLMGGREIARGKVHRRDLMKALLERG